MKTSKDLHQQTVATYRTLRLTLAVLALAFPILLWLGGALLGHLPLASSMSAYYHAIAADPAVSGQGVMRDEFVGILFAVGALLLVYQGYSQLEDWALDLAAVFAVGIALFPMHWPQQHDHTVSAHGVCAVAFFVCIAYVCVFRANDTIHLIQDVKVRTRFHHTYKILGYSMLVIPFATWAVIALFPFKTSVVFFVELAGIYVFAIYWITKSREAAKTKLDERAVRGHLSEGAHGLSTLFRTNPVAVRESDRDGVF